MRCLVMGEWGITLVWILSLTGYNCQEIHFDFGHYTSANTACVNAAETQDTDILSIVLMSYIYSLFSKIRIIENNAWLNEIWTASGQNC